MTHWRKNSANKLSRMGNRRKRNEMHRPFWHLAQGSRSDPWCVPIVGITTRVSGSAADKMSISFKISFRNVRHKPVLVLSSHDRRQSNSGARPTTQGEPQLLQPPISLVYFVALRHFVSVIPIGPTCQKPLHERMFQKNFSNFPVSGPQVTH